MRFSAASRTATGSRSRARRDQRSLQLMRQQGRRAALVLAVFHQSLAPAGGIGGNGAEQPLELIGAIAVELRVGATRQLGDLRKEPRSDAVIAFLEDEHRQSE